MHALRLIHSHTRFLPATSKFQRDVTQAEQHFKRPTHSQLNWAILVWRHNSRKNWVNCAVLTGNRAGLRTVLSSRLSHTELRSSRKGIPQFPQFTCRHHDGIISRHSVSSNSVSRWASNDISLFKYHFLHHILRFLFFFSENIMADVVSKQQMTALFLSTIVTRTRRHKELAKKTDKPHEKPVLCHRTFSSVFRAVFFTQLNCTV